MAARGGVGWPALDRHKALVRGRLKRVTSLARRRNFFSFFPPTIAQL